MKRDDDAVVDFEGMQYRLLRHLQCNPAPIELNPFTLVLEMCRRANPGISLDDHILGGIPHIDGTRLGVGQVLGRLYDLGSIENVAAYYAELNLTEDQVKEAIGFAQDFVELAGDPYQPYD